MEHEKDSKQSSLVFARNTRETKYADRILMAYFIKIIIAVVVIVLVTELSKKDTKLAALLLALPIISFTAYTMIWFESKDIEKIAKLANENFIYVLPVMPVLPLFSWMLKNGYGYFTSMIMVIILMILLFYLLQKTL